MKSIICADDEVTIQRILQRILEGRGYDVRLCANGAEVMAQFEERPADLILLDVSMPVMSGIDACKELRRRPESFDVPIIMVSGIGNEDTITKGLSAGADDYILKPFQAEEILAKVAMALKKRETQTASDLGMAIGSRFVGRYDIQNKISSGGFSTIFLATDVSQDPPLEVALKIFDLPLSKRSDSRFISLFLREAYQLAKLDHPHIVKLHEFGQSGHFYFLALEFLRGEALDRRVTRDGPMESREVITIGYEIALALQFLHRHRMVHRDVKPANIFLTEEGIAKLVDFGLAKQQDEATLSLSDEFRGTPAFVSPEYILGNNVVDIKSDVYSLGVTLYYAMSSVILFAGTNAMEILNKHFQVIPPPLQQFDPMVNEEFSQLIDRMLAKERDQRPGIDEVVTSFEKIMAQERSSGKKLIFKLRKAGDTTTSDGEDLPVGKSPGSGQFQLKQRTDQPQPQVIASRSGLFRLKLKQSRDELQAPDAAARKDPPAPTGNDARPADASGAEAPPSSAPASGTFRMKLKPTEPEQREDKPD